MRRGPIGVLVVAGVAAAIIAYRETGRPSFRTPATLADKSQATPSILLVADLKEADTDDPCAEIIRLVRAAAQRGIAVREIPTGENDPLLRKYRVTVEPAVLLLDGRGNVLARHEGESQETIAALRADLERLTLR